MPGSSYHGRGRMALVRMAAFAWIAVAGLPVLAQDLAAPAQTPAPIAALTLDMPPVDMPPPPVPGGLGVSPVVLELYTAQGCTACPPADAMLASLADRSDVIALALHVDYWDYIGWADGFADPEFAERQKRYARVNGLGTIYTPQVVINGQDLMEGFRVMAIMEAIEAQLRAPPEAWVSLTRTDPDHVAVRGAPIVPPPVVVASRGMTPGVGATVASALAAAAPQAVQQGRGAEPHDVVLVRYIPRATVEITAGENAGLTGEYANIVTQFEVVGTWDLQGELDLTLPAPGDEAVVVMVQEPRQRAIVAAARLD